jgi:hypothetical protein
MHVTFLTTPLRLCTLHSGDVLTTNRATVNKQRLEAVKNVLVFCFPMRSIETALVLVYMAF